MGQFFYEVVGYQVFLHVYFGEGLIEVYTFKKIKNKNCTVFVVYHFNTYIKKIVCFRVLYLLKGQLLYI